MNPMQNLQEWETSIEGVAISDMPASWDEQEQQKRASVLESIKYEMKRTAAGGVIKTSESTFKAI